MKNRYYLFILVGAILIGAVIWMLWPAKKTLAPTVNTNAISNSTATNVSAEVDQPVNEDRIAFSTSDLPDRDPAFDFSLNIPKSWRAEYLDTSKAINFYDHTQAGSSLKTSQMFVTHYTASSFAQHTAVPDSQEGTITNDNLPVTEYIRPKVTSKLPSGYPTWWTKQHLVAEIQTGQSAPYTFFVFEFDPSTEQLDRSFLGFIHFNP